MTADLGELKRRLRAEAKARRAAAARAAPEAGEAVARRLTEALDGGAIGLEAGGAVTAYWPMDDELDPRPAMTMLAARGHPVGLPVVVARGAPLAFRRWSPGDELVPAGFGLLEPAAGRPELMPALLLVPLLAFDRTGMRLGYGGGFYDRTLARLRAPGARAPLAVGIAYAGQEMADLPRSPSDQALDWVLTETGTIEIGGGRAAAVLR